MGAVQSRGQYSMYRFVRDYLEMVKVGADGDFQK